MTEYEKKVILALADKNMNVSAAARKVKYHRNTVVYHIERIKDKTGLNPCNFFDLLKLLKMVQKSGDI